MSRLIFITGTDTGVGKTVLTCLLLAQLRGSGQHALALKPFCSGSRDDARLLRSIQDCELTLDQVNPFYFEDPVAPLVAARKRRQNIPSVRVLDHIQVISKSCECLLIEGIGGLLVPLGEGYTVLDLITQMEAEVIVVAADKLGTINHTLLTVNALRHSGVSRLKLVLMGQKHPDQSCASNANILREWVATPILVLFLRSACRTRLDVKRHAADLKQTLRRALAQIEEP